MALALPCLGTPICLMQCRVLRHTLQTTSLLALEWEIAHCQGSRCKRLTPALPIGLLCHRQSTSFLLHHSTETTTHSSDIQSYAHYFRTSVTFFQYPWLVSYSISTLQAHRPLKCIQCRRMCWASYSEKDLSCILRNHECARPHYSPAYYGCRHKLVTQHFSLHPHQREEEYAKDCWS